MIMQDHILKNGGKDFDSGYRNFTSPILLDYQFLKIFITYRIINKLF